MTVTTTHVPHLHRTAVVDWVGLGKKMIWLGSENIAVTNIFT